MWQDRLCKSEAERLSSGYFDAERLSSGHFDAERLSSGHFGAEMTCLCTVRHILNFSYKLLYLVVILLILLYSKYGYVCVYTRIYYS